MAELEINFLHRKEKSQKSGQATDNISVQEGGQSLKSGIFTDTFPVWQGKIPGKCQS